MFFWIKTNFGPKRVDIFLSNIFVKIFACNCDTIKKHPESMMPPGCSFILYPFRFRKNVPDYPQCLPAS